MARRARAVRAPPPRDRPGAHRVSRTAGALHGVPSPENRWEGSSASGLSTLEGLVYRSNLLGADRALATITSAGFAGLRLDELLPLRARQEMDDASMVEHLLRSALRPDQPRPSIETLLHAFIPAPHVDHTHPDAVIALTSSPEGRRLAEETFGDEIVWLDYQRPGFYMARRISQLLDANPSARAVFLEKH